MKKRYVILILLVPMVVGVFMYEMELLDKAKRMVVFITLCILAMGITSDSRK